MRRCGYTPSGMELVQEEVDHIDWAVARYLDGTPASEIAEGLNGRGARTSSGKLWGGHAVRMLMGSRYHAGIRVFRGEPVGRGVWPVVFDAPTWEELGRARA